MHAPFQVNWRLITQKRISYWILATSLKNGQNLMLSYNQVRARKKKDYPQRTSITTLGDAVPESWTVQNYAARLRTEWENLKDDPSFGFPATTSTGEKIECLTRWWWMKTLSSLSESFLTDGTPSSETPMEEVCGVQGRLFWQIEPHLVIFHESNLIRKWMVQPTFVYEKNPRTESASLKYEWQLG